MIQSSSLHSRKWVKSPTASKKHELFNAVQMWLERMMEREDPPRGRCQGPWRAMSKGATFRAKLNLIKQRNQPPSQCLSSRTLELTLTSNSYGSSLPFLKGFYCSYCPCSTIVYQLCSWGVGSTLCFQSICHWTVRWILVETM